ncbi:MAG: cation:proton antiporter, partial [Chloroflexota bacterium]
MTALTAILIHLFIMFAAAKLGGELFSRLRQPAVIGEVLAGMLIGPYALGLVGTPPAPLIEALHGEEPAREGLYLVYHIIAELGVIVLLFYVGLETRLSDLKHVGWRAVLVGVLGILLPFGLGLGFMATQPTPQITDTFVATALVATSVGITARVLRDLGVLHSVEARIILGAAVIDDILGM